MRPVHLRGGARGRFAEAEAFAASARIGLLQIESSGFASVAGGTVDVLFAEAVRRVLVADLLGGTAHVAVAQLAVRERPVAEGAALTHPPDDVVLALALAG